MDDPYRRLALHLDALPNGFPPAEDGAELRLLAKIFSPEEAALASELRLQPETPAQIAERLRKDPQALATQLKALARKGLIHASRGAEGIAYGALPFVVGIYEYQIGVMDAEMARLFEAYYQQAFGRMLAMQPSVHRVIPVQESVRAGVQIEPFESASALLDQAQSWGSLDCICRKQKALLGDACEHPIDVCLTFSQRPNAYDGNPVVHALTREQALATLRRAADAGLVHTVSNSQQDVSYVCSCCTCSCGILRGITDLGIASVVARSGYVNQVDEASCVGCDLCLDACQFQALTLHSVVRVDEARCVGCGVCVPVCPEGSLGLVRRPAQQVAVPPRDAHDWQIQRARSRGLPLKPTAG